MFEKEDDKKKEVSGSLGSYEVRPQPTNLQIFQILKSSNLFKLSNSFPNPELLHSAMIFPF